MAFETNLVEPESLFQSSNQIHDGQFYQTEYDVFERSIFGIRANIPINSTVRSSYSLAYFLWTDSIQTENKTRVSRQEPKQKNRQPLLRSFNRH